MLGSTGEIMRRLRVGGLLRWEMWAVVAWTIAACLVYQSMPGRSRRWGGATGGYAVDARLEAGVEQAMAADVRRAVSVMPRGEQLVFAAARTRFLWGLGDRERRVYSQNGEDGVIEHLFDNLGEGGRTYVELGTEDGSECNTRLLWERSGWDGVLVDGGGVAADGRNIHNVFLTPGNVGAVLGSLGAAKQADLMSVDVDYDDYYVGKAIMEAGYRPRVLVQEINRNFGPGESYTVVPRGEAGGLGERERVGKCITYWGMSQLAAARLYAGYGYVPVYVDRRAVNMFFVSVPSVVSWLHTLGATGVTERDFMELLAPPFRAVYRRGGNTVCEGEGSDAEIEFREDEMPAQRWVRVP